MSLKTINLKIRDIGVHGLIIMWEEGGGQNGLWALGTLTHEGIKLEKGRFSPFNSVTKYWGGALPPPSPIYAYDPT